MPDFVALRIWNTGPMVHPACLAQLFQPFVRGSAPRVRSGGGAGLGLSIVDAIAAAHHGAIAAEAQGPWGWILLAGSRMAEGW